MGDKSPTQIRRTRLPVICSGCQLEVADPGTPLDRYRCPRCDAELVQVAVPEELGFDRPLPLPVRLPNQGTTSRREAQDILLVEDDLDDAFFMNRAFEHSGSHSKIRILSDGKQAVRYLTAMMEDPTVPLPKIVITDLKMPLKSGFEVIAWIRSQSGLSTVPVVVLSVSEEPVDVNQARSLGANGYYVKPFRLAKLNELAKSLVAGNYDFKPKSN
jgi:CheY-like chemotaxis protein